MREKVLKELPEEFNHQDLARCFPESETKSLQRVLTDLIKEGQLETSGRGKARRWTKKGDTNLCP